MAECVEPGGFAFVDQFGEALCLLGGSGGCLCELGRPPADLTSPVGGEPADVGLWFGGEDEADRRDVIGHLTASTQHGVDQCAAGTAVAVSEWMDGLELSVGDRGLSDWRDVVAVDERGQVPEQGSDVFGRRWHVAGADGVIVVATDPVLLVADDAVDVGVGGGAQKRPLNVLDVGRFE